MKLYKWKTTTVPSKINIIKKIVLKNRLHFPSGSSGIKTICQVDHHRIHVASVCYVDCELVGICFITDPWWGYNLMVYVKPEYRRRGIGSTLVVNAKRRKRNVQNGYYEVYGVGYRNNFYRKLGITNW